MSMQNRIDAARKYIGLHEVKDNYILQGLLGLNPAKTAWCAAFVNAIEKECGADGTGAWNAKSYLNYGESIVEDSEEFRPEPGNIVIFDRGGDLGHVAYVTRYNNDTIWTLGGNQNNMVCEEAHSWDKLIDIRRI